jgi:hypothetical protein
VTIADCELQTFSAGGPGGQHQNRSRTGVRIIHHASGARGECREERSQWENKKRAWRRMCESRQFRLWLALETGRLDAIQAEISRVEIPQEDLLIEVCKNGRFVKETDL